MYGLILQSIVLLSLGVVIFLMAKAVSRIQENPGVANSTASQTNYLDRLLDKIPLNKLDAFISNFLSKILRRLKVCVLKVDNLITNYLNKLLKKNNNGGDNHLTQQ